MSNIEVFEQVVKEFKKLLDNKKAEINFQKNSITISISNRPKNGILKDLPEHQVSQIFNEIVELLPRILLDIEFDDRSDSGKEIFDKIKIINNYLVTEKLRKKFHLVNTSVSKTIKSIELKPIIKPISKGQLSNLVTGIIKFNLQEDKKIESFSFEITTNELVDIVKVLNNFCDKLTELEDKTKKINF